ncbi:g10142 [Coccomyxa viridis]|uniref:G10142 protein n=1 Tax=Coccomyxa viridis TaxID=1274662 RepID=A0ABP1G4T6_9CHLO
MPAGTEGDTQLTQVVLKGLGDKLYDKRKAAALEVEQLIKNLSKEEKWRAVVHILKALVEDYAYSPQANCRKGGLLALAAAAVALADRKGELKRQGKDWTGPDYLATVVPAVLNSLVDADARVRYYACEALYNIAKMSREDFLEPHFNSTFDALFRLVADPDAAVNQACTFLDSLMKDIVTAHEHFNMDGFVGQFQTALQVTSPKKRMFLLDWMGVLASVPDLDIVAYLPLFLSSLMDCLTDPLSDVRSKAAKVLQDLLIEMQNAEAHSLDYLALASVLVTGAKSGEDAIRLTALRWLRVIIADAKAQLLPLYASILQAILPALSSTFPDILEVAREANAELLELPPEWEASDPAALLAAVANELHSTQEATRLSALLWLNTLLSRSRKTVLAHLDLLLPSLFDALHAPSERVVVEALSVQAAIAADDPQQFRTLMQEFIDRFRGPGGARLLQRRGGLVVRKLAARLGGRAVLSMLSSILEDEQDLPFAAALVQALNLILLTAPELKDLRLLLRSAAHSEDGASLFKWLYRSWCHSLGAVLSLCFLSEAYGHAYELASCYAELPMGVEVLVQIDRLVQLLETPVFNFLRLHLLHPARFPALLWSMYALLMLLPQSEAFKTLHARLHSVPTVTLLKMDGQPPPHAPSAAWDSPSLRARDGPERRASLDVNGSMWGKRQGSTGSSGGSRDSKEGSEVPYSELLPLFRKRQLAHAQDEERRRGAGPESGADDMFMRGFGADFNEALPGPASRRSMPDTSAFAYR